jgi:hypothetical protein
MLYNGDGAPTSFCEMYPGATLADYNSSGGSFLYAPGSSAPVQIGSQSYDVSYNGSWGGTTSGRQPTVACNVRLSDSE